jgi:hypothetical protein
MLKIQGIFVEIGATGLAKKREFGTISTPKLHHLPCFSQCGPNPVTNHPALRRLALTTHDLA